MVSSSGVTVGVGLMGVEGLVMAGEGEGRVGMGVVVDFSAILVVLGGGGRDGVAVGFDDGVSVVMGWKSGVPVPTKRDDGFPVSVRLDGVSVVMGWKSGVPVSVR